MVGRRCGRTAGAGEWDVAVLSALPTSRELLSAGQQAHDLDRGAEDAGAAISFAVRTAWQASNGIRFVIMACW
jgi:hypothetical protein